MPSKSRSPYLGRQGHLRPGRALLGFCPDPAPPSLTYSPAPGTAASVLPPTPTRQAHARLRAFALCPLLRTASLQLSVRPAPVDPLFELHEGRVFALLAGMSPVPKTAPNTWA